MMWTALPGVGVQLPADSATVHEAATRVHAAVSVDERRVLVLLELITGPS